MSDRWVVYKDGAVEAVLQGQFFSSFDAVSSYLDAEDAFGLSPTRSGVLDAVQSKGLPAFKDRDEVLAVAAENGLAIRLRNIDEVAAWIAAFGESFRAEESLLPEDVKSRAWRFAVYTLVGSNEGHYIHVDVLSKAERRGSLERSCWPIFVAKTFAGEEEADRFCRILRRVLDA